ncbi:MAG: hypothetical protein AAF546_02470 [Verrucomicrobiota bacterium]
MLAWRHSSRRFTGANRFRWIGGGMGVLELLDADLRVNLRRGQKRVSEHLLDVADFCAVFAVLMWQGQAKRPVGVADTEPLQGLLMPQAALFQVVDGRRVFVQSLGIVKLWRGL